MVDRYDPGCPHRFNAVKIAFDEMAKGLTIAKRAASRFYYNTHIGNQESYHTIIKAEEAYKMFSERDTVERDS